MTLSIVTWRWGTAPFTSGDVNILRAMLARHVHLDHRLYCVTDDPAGLDGDIVPVPLSEFKDTPRCRRRMKQFDRAMVDVWGPRMLSIDLDVVIVDDLTLIASRTEPIVGWKVAYAGVYSGSFLMLNTGELHPLYEAFAADPVGYPQRAGRGVPSDQAMLNTYISSNMHGCQSRIGTLTEADGFVTYFGEGYERLEERGVGPGHPELPVGARIVVLGSADKSVLDEGRFDWVKAHWRLAA